MESGMSSNLMHIGISVFLITLVLGICKFRKWTLKEYLAFRVPTVKSLIFWVFLFVILVVVEEFTIKLMGIGEVTPWNYSTLTSVIRAFGMVVLAPIGEEMVFRGLLFKRISDTRLGVYGAILIPALIFAGIHVQYSVALMVFIFIDGVFYGLARNYSKSLLVPIILHSLGNLYAVVQRIIG